MDCKIVKIEVEEFKSWCKINHNFIIGDYFDLQGIDCVNCKSIFDYVIFPHNKYIVLVDFEVEDFKLLEKYLKNDENNLNYCHIIFKEDCNINNLVKLYMREKKLERIVK